MESRIIQLLLIPVRMHIWKQGSSYVAVIFDDLAERYLLQFLNRIVSLNIEDKVTLKTKLIQLRQGSRQYIVMYLPKMLQPTWDELKARDELYGIIKIELEKDTPPEEPGSFKHG